MGNAGLYIHIPFCARKCAYCDFVSFAGREDAMDAYINALLREIRGQSVLKAFDTVYIGGGTPSFLPAGFVARILKEAFAAYDIAPGAEVTIEANPCSLTEKKLEEYLTAGVNRVSLGVQSLSDTLLQILGRAHTVGGARTAMGLLRDSGVSWSADVMLSLPGQSAKGVNATLAGIFAFSPGHVSAYPLILEEGTPLCGRVARGELSLPGEDEAYDLETLAIELLASAGYERYEISSFAKPGQHSRHNINYWNNGAYAGLGAAAHGAHRGRDGLWVRTENPMDLDAYISGAKRTETSIPREDEMFETIMLALRKIEGLCLAAFAARFHARFEEKYARQIGELRADGLLKLHNGFVALSSRGLEIQNRVLLRFL